MDRTFLLAGAVAAFIAVGFGAFGAHGLRGRLGPDMLAVFETAVRYHMYHALALLLTAAVLPRFGGWLIYTAGWCFIAGIVLFSGSLYALALSGVTVLGAITPIGGLAFLAGGAHACLAADAARRHAISAHARRYVPRRRRLRRDAGASARFVRRARRRVAQRDRADPDAHQPRRHARPRHRSHAALGAAAAG